MNIVMYADRVTLLHWYDTISILNFVELFKKRVHKVKSVVGCTYEELGQKLWVNIIRLTFAFVQSQIINTLSFVKLLSYNIYFPPLEALYDFLSQFQPVEALEVIPHISYKKQS